MYGKDNKFSTRIGGAIGKDWHKDDSPLGSINKSQNSIDLLIFSYREQMIDTMSKMVAIKAISPKSGGMGESKRAKFLASILEGW
ncbi:MAG: hypothetical protein KGH64_03175, partial [Candidatus Micrarchaeota archaeon]|nr:hypothetical protein [Candidatus Micrarchaeota archaeon]